MTNNKNLFLALGILAAIVLVLVIAISVFNNNTLPSIAAQPTGPHVVEQNPVAGQRLGLSAPIQIIFDRDMDPSTTESFSLLVNAEVVPGKGVWSNPRTFTFTPDAPLQPGTVYTATFTTQARAKDGTSLAENAALEFKTIEGLSVGQVFPAEKTADVDLGSSITVIFNHPVVPLTIVEEQSKLPQPLKFKPELKGKGEWVNSSVYVFEPQKDLLSGTNYVVSVDAGITDTLGNSLKDSFSWQFNTRSPLIANFALKGGAQNPTEEVKDVPLDQVFIVTFQQVMNPQSVEGSTSIVNRETRERFPVTFSWNADFTEVTITPDGKFNLGGYYELLMARDTQAVDGGNLKEGLDIQFTTVPLPAVVDVSPPAYSKYTAYNPNIAIVFASQMDFESMKGKVQISPALKSEDNWFYSEYDNTLYINGLEAGTDYVVRILRGMKDVYGNTIEGEMSYTFSNGDYHSYAQLIMPWTPLIYRAQGIQDVYFEHVNVNEATVSVYPITLEEFEKLSNGDVPANEFNPKVTAVRQWKILGGEKNVIQSERFLLNENDESLAPGYYFIGLQGKPLGYSSNFHQGSLFVIATDNVTFKATSTEGLAWVTDLESGVPQKNVSVTFYDNHSKELGNTTTDENGLAYLKNIGAVNFAQASGDGHFGFTALYWGSGVSAGDFGIYENYYSGATNLFAYLYTDRPVYRPDQELFFKGILRGNDDLHYSLPKEKQVYVVAEQFGEKIFSEYVKVNEQGSFTGTVKLAQGISLGPYNIYVYKTNSPEEAPISSVGFNVAEYKKPEFEVSATADKTDILTGDKVKFGFDATYYSGGNLKGAALGWYVESTNYYFTPKDKYSQYNFIDWDRDIYWDSGEDRSTQIFNEGNGETDANGHFEVSQTLDVGKDKLGKNVTFYSNVTDVAGNTVSGSASVVVHQTEVYAGIRSEKYIGMAGEAQPFSVAALNWDSTPVAGQAVSVDFVERQWFSVQKKDAQGMLTWETSVKDIPVSKQDATTDADGIAQVSFVPSKGGVYKATVTVRDSKGNTQHASAYIWVASNEAITWRQTNDRAFSLIADKEMYKPGETAEILIAQPFEKEVYALVTYERGHIYKQEVLLLKGNSTIYKLPITDELAPIAYVSVTVVSGAEQGGKPDFKIGMVKINIDTKQKTIDVKVTADKKSAGPGDEVTYTIETKDVNGKPVSADVSLAVVDKAVLALAPANSTPMLGSFYSQQSLSVVTSLGLVSSADDFNENYRNSIPDGHSAGGGGGEGLGVITVRQNFKDTAVFEGVVTTDENGTAQVKVKLPENLTTWSADARAVTADTRVGQTTGELVSTKPLYVQLQTPRFFIVGDEVTIGATVFNNTDTSLKANVLLDAQGVEIKSDALQTIDVEAKQQAYVTWNVTVDNTAQRVDLTATATSGAFTDASKPALGTLPDQGIPVYNFTATETVGTSGMITSADSVTENIQLPTTFKFDDAKLSIEVSPSLAASMTSGLTYLEDYPYLCMEQTVSRFLPNVVAMRALKEAGISSPLKSGLDAQVSAALQRIYAKQLYDGGWNWWDGDKSDPQTSAYVIYGLLEAQQSGYDISQTVLDNGIGYLKTNVPDIRRNGASWQYNRHAFILYVLARADQLSAGQTNFIYENRASLDHYGEAYLAQALYILDPKDSRVDTLMSDLVSSAALSAAGAHWEEKTKDYWNWNSDTRTTAIVLNAFTQIDPQNPLTANTVRWLMAHRDRGHWYSTQETTWSLIALTNWLTVSKEYETDYKYAIGLNGNMLKDGQASKDNLTDTVKLQVELKDLLKDQANALVFARGEGKGNLYYSAYLSATLPVDKVQPLDQGMTLSREYFTLDDAKTPITETKRGELVKVRLTLVVPDSVHHIVVNDPLPAGLEAVNESLLTDTAVPSSYTKQDYTDRGWGWWYFTHIELHDEKVTLSTDYLPAGTYVYTYIARASTAGTFKVIPPTAAEFYFPDVAGRGAGTVFTVR